MTQGAAEGALATAVSGALLLAVCRPAAGWPLAFIAGGAAFLINAALVGRARSRVRRALQGLAEAACLAAGGDPEARVPETGNGEIGRASRAVNQLLAATRAERSQVEARLHELEVTVHDLDAASRRREAELAAQLRLASRALREPALHLHACASLLARDSSGRLDAKGKERLAQLRASAETLDARLHDALNGCRYGATRETTTTRRGVVASGDQGDATGVAEMGG